MTPTTSTQTPPADPFADLRQALAHVTDHLNGFGAQDDLDWALRRIEEEFPVLLADARRRAELEADNRELRRQVESLRDTVAAVAPIVLPLWDMARKQVMSLWRALAPVLEPGSGAAQDTNAADDRVEPDRATVSPAAGIDELLAVEED